MRHDDIPNMMGRGTCSCFYFRLLLALTCLSCGASVASPGRQQVRCPANAREVWLGCQNGASRVPLIDALCHRCPTAPPTPSVSVFQALIWSRKSTGLPIEIRSAHATSLSSKPAKVSYCKLDIDIEKVWAQRVTLLCAAVFVTACVLSPEPARAAFPPATGQHDGMARHRNHAVHRRQLDDVPVPCHGVHDPVSHHYPVRPAEAAVRVPG